jgi:hypothetical protein
LQITLKIVSVKTIEDPDEKMAALHSAKLTIEDLSIPEASEASIKQTMGIAYYNLAVEYEHTNNLS